MQAISRPKKSATTSSLNEENQVLLTQDLDDENNINNNNCCSSAFNNSNQENSSLLEEEQQQVFINNNNLNQNNDDDEDQQQDGAVPTSATAPAAVTSSISSSSSSTSKNNNNNNAKSSSSGKSTKIQKNSVIETSAAVEDSSSMETFNNNNNNNNQEGLLSIERLADSAIGMADINKLKSAGIFTIPGINMQCRKELLGIKGLSDAKVDKIIEAAKKLTNYGFVKGTDALQRRKSILRITTGCRAFDDLLGGGIESNAITEAFGEFRTGKSQIAHTLCVTCQLDLNVGGGAGKAIYIDTEATFRPERIKPIAERFGLNPEAVLDNILVARAFTHEHQANLIAAVAAQMAKDRYALIVVDSITALFRSDFSGRGELAERQQKLCKMMNHLIKLAEEFNVAVYITNQVVADPGAAAMFVADPKKPIGGHILAHASTVRLSLRKGRGEDRLCKIYDSPNLPEHECAFSICEDGINDAKNTATATVGVTPNG